MITIVAAWWYFIERPERAAEADYRPRHRGADSDAEAIQPFIDMLNGEADRALQRWLPGAGPETAALAEADADAADTERRLDQSAWETYGWPDADVIADWLSTGQLAYAHWLSR